jgi:hypothetical protein
MVIGVQAGRVCDWGAGREGMVIGVQAGRVGDWGAGSAYRILILPVFSMRKVKGILKVRSSLCSIDKKSIVCTTRWLHRREDRGK